MNSSQFVSHPITIIRLSCHSHFPDSFVPVSIRFPLTAETAPVTNVLMLTLIEGNKLAMANF